MHKLSILRGTEFFFEHMEQFRTLSLKSSFNAGGNGVLFRQFINSYPQIFPHFFDINESHNGDRHFECFVNNILRFIKELFQYECDYLNWVRSGEPTFKKKYAYDLSEYLRDQHLIPTPSPTDLTITREDGRIFLKG